MNRLRTLKTASLNYLGWSRKYAADLWHWLWAPRAVRILFAAVLFLLVLAYLFSSCVEREIRLSGMLLQLFGLFVVWTGLQDTRRAFEEQPTTWAAMKQYWAKRPSFGPQHHVLSAVGTAVGAASSEARARVSAGPNTPLGRRVEILEQQYTSLFDEVGALSADMKKKYDELFNAIQTERQEREAGEKYSRAQIRGAVAEGIYLQFVGAIFFALGTVAGTASPELASFVGAAAECR
jgi:hypothetical protein